MAPGGVAPPRITLKGGRFHKVVDANVETLTDPYIDVSIVSYIPTVSRVWFKGAYNPQAEPTMPDCWSTDGRIPDANVPLSTKQNGTCQGCPQDTKGSGNTGLTKSCGYKKRLMVIPLDEYQFGIEALTYTLDAPGMSVFGEDDPANSAYSLQSLAKSMEQHGLDPAYLHAVAMRISFDVRASVPKLLFQPLEYVQEHELQWIISLIEQDAEVIKEQTTSIISGGAPVTAPAQPVQQPTMQPQQQPMAQPTPAPAPQPPAPPPPAPSQAAVRRRTTPAPVQEMTTAHVPPEPEVLPPQPQQQMAPQPTAPARGRRAPPQPVAQPQYQQPAPQGAPTATVGMPPTRRSAARAAQQPQAQAQSGPLPVVPAGGLQTVLSQI
jgi:hypothetical protein